MTKKEYLLSMLNFLYQDIEHLVKRSALAKKELESQGVDSFRMEETTIKLDSALGRLSRQIAVVESESA